jgi:hypothetical protein
MEDCVIYLVVQLRKAGFEVRFTWPNLLWISWRHTEGEYITKQNPIIQAMVPEPPKPLPTSQKKGKQQASAPQPTSNPRAYNDEINIITKSNIQSSSFGTTPITATPRSAAEYKPPDSFIQTLERPGPGRTPGGAAAAGGTQRTGDILTDLWNF